MKLTTGEKASVWELAAKILYNYVATSAELNGNVNNKMTEHLKSVAYSCFKKSQIIRRRKSGEG